MSRAFTSEEYESAEMKIDIRPETPDSGDHELVLSYSGGRNVNDPSLPYEIGMHFLRGDAGFFQSDEFAEKWLKKAVDVGNRDAMLELAEFYLKDTKANGYRTSARLLKKATDLGSERAKSRLDMTAVTDRTTKAAFVTYRLNAELGSREACVLLAEGFEKEYYGKNKPKAVVLWYKHAFKRGDVESGKHLLQLYYHKKVELTEEEVDLLRGKEE